MHPIPLRTMTYAVLTLVSLIFLGFGFAMDVPGEIARGLLRIVTEPSILITDYIALGGLGAAFVNAGALMLLSTALLRLNKVDAGGLSVASVFLMGSFALFGKNLVNVWPVLLGTALYARTRREKFAAHVHTGLLATSIAPLVTELLFVVDLPAPARVLLALAGGASVGFLIVPLCASLCRLHRGLSLYNVGFSVGILGTVYVSLFKSYGYSAYNRLLWSTDAHAPLGLFLAALFGAMLLAGVLLDRGALGGMLRIARHAGTLGTDFIALDGIGPSLCNMGLNGILAAGYVLLVGGPFNGPTVGGILTVCGFGAFGKHCRNILPIFAGVLIGGLTKTWNLDDPSSLFAALFGTSLAPVAGHFGWFWGMVAGFLNSSVVLNSGFLHGGMNLYNTGFAAGIVSSALVPLLDAFPRKKAAPERDLSV